jgi:Zn-dependent peptidase ImmA (M78 family)
MMNKGKLAAIRLRNEIGLVDPVDLPIEDVIIVRGGYVQYKPMGKVDGRIVYGKRLSIIYINSDIQYEGRKRFALAHELGHLEMHKGTVIHDDNIGVQWFSSTNEHMKNGDQEYEANQFATEYLMPTVLFNSLANKESFSPQLIHYLADRFLTSLTSVMYRYFDSALHPIAMFHIDEGKVKYWKKSIDLKVYIKDITKLPPPLYSVAMEYIEADYKPIYGKGELMQPIDKSTWFELKDGDEDSEFFEYCIVTRRYKNILSIVWER